MKTAPSCLDKDVRPIRHRRRRPSTEEGWSVVSLRHSRARAHAWGPRARSRPAPPAPLRRPQLRFPCLILAGEAVRPAGTVGRRPGPPGPAAP